MRTVAITIFVTCLSALSVANSFNTARCFSKIERKISPGDTVTVFTDNGAALRGMFPSVLPGGSALYLRAVIDSSGSFRLTIPLAHINKITYRKRCNVCKVLGLGVGFIGGAIAGAALAPEARSRGFFDDSKIGFGLVGAIIGTFVGASGGAEIDKLFTITLSLECD